MAKRSREHRQEIPGYDESRPSREERKQQHRQIRHSTHQMLHMVHDPEEVDTLPEPVRSGHTETNYQANEPEHRRFRVWKTKFWKRRDGYKQMKMDLDAHWPVITPEQIEEHG